MTAIGSHTFESARRDREYWGRLVESAVGAYLVNSVRGSKIEVFYWLERNQEVDFVLRSGKNVVALEVKSGRTRTLLPGMNSFAKAFKPKGQLLLGPEGIPLEEFMATPLDRWIGWIHWANGGEFRGINKEKAHLSKADGNPYLCCR